MTYLLLTAHPNVTRRPEYRWLLFLCLCLLSINRLYGQEAINDHIFPAAGKARTYIDFDKKGFLIRGKRTFLVSAGIEYARLPRELWRDRLLRLKRGGFNCVEIYTIWNFHEPKEGQFDFKGDHDLGAFLSLVQRLHMYAIVRVGPYYCAEWENGGYPLWLRFKKGIRVREENTVFERCVDRYFDRLLPIVFSRQINRGGAVIMIQLENEHPLGWGTTMPNSYFTHLRATALRQGLQVPYFFSGLHHESDPAGDGRLDNPARPNPWFSTELWSVWYNQYGAKPADSAVYERRVWKIIAHGGAGYNCYMAYGGTNFAYHNNNEDAASYDYGAPVGQGGDLRPIYYGLKRAAWFARSFQEILENSRDNSAAWAHIVSDPGLKVTARSGSAGQLLFLDNRGTKPINSALNIAAVKLPPNVKLHIEPGEIYPLVHNFRVNRNTTLAWALTRVHAIFKQANTTTILAEAKPGTPVCLHFLTAGKATVTRGDSGIKAGLNRLTIQSIAPQRDQPVEYMFHQGKFTVRVLVMTRELIDRTWLMDDQAPHYLITGAPYLRDIQVNKTKLTATAEYPVYTKVHTGLRAYSDINMTALKNRPSATPDPAVHLRLTGWEVKNAAAIAANNHRTRGWLRSSDPMQMGADGDLTANAWYRSDLNVPETGRYALQVSGGDRAMAYIDGKVAANWYLQNGEVMLNLIKGEHTLFIFTSHDGRDKLAAYMGPLAMIDRKGLSGQVMIKKGGPFITRLTNWYFTPATSAEEVKSGLPKFKKMNWKKYKIGDDAFHLKKGFGWFQTSIPTQPGIDRLKFSFKSVDENATVFINGKKVARHEGWNTPFEVLVDDPDILKHAINLCVFIENYSKEGGIDQEVRMNTIGEATTVKNWQLRGGPGRPDATLGWARLAKGSSFAGPAFFRTDLIVPELKNAAGVYRVNAIGMGHGSVWINGHNLGRYPEKTVPIGLYIPECWLKTGKNRLVVFDEDGKRPDKINVSLEPAASRTVNLFSN